MDSWHEEKLNLITVPNTRENLERIHKIFAYNSSCMQNIVHYRPDNFEIQILTQPFMASGRDALADLPAAEAEKVFRQYLAFVSAAREWNMDFLDYSQFQILPGTGLRFAWKLEAQSFPPASDFISLFNQNRHLHGLNEKNYRDFFKRTAAPPEFPVYLCRREDFASNLLHSHFPRKAISSANIKIRINTKSHWQKSVVRDNLFHNLNDEETLLLKIDLERVSMNDFFSTLCGRKNLAEEDLAAQVQELHLFLQRSVFQETILLIENLGGKEDDRFLRFLLESGDVAGMTVVLFNDSLPCDCDLEFNEAPQNQMTKHLAALFGGSEPWELSESEDRLLRKFILLDVPVPMTVARQLAGQGGDAQIASLLKKRCLLENRSQQTLSLNTAGGAAPPSSTEKSELLAWLAANTEWAYARVAHFIASGQTVALEQYLANRAMELPNQVAPGPAADLIRVFLPQATNGKILEHFVDILIQSNCLSLAAKVLAENSTPESVFARLKTAHLAMRQKQYQKLGKLLAGMPKVPRGFRDEWLYLNFIYHEKISQKSKVEDYAKEIKSPYFRNLALIQLSDRSIYNRDFNKARTQLAGALKYFSAGNRYREEIEVQSQMAKLLREEGRFREAESLYKTIYIKSEAEGLAPNSAFAAVDLGNLYFERDDDFQSECWYRKALKSFAGEKNTDGLMLVNSNLVNILITKGNWLEADKLLRDILAWDEEKQLPNSCAIDNLNWASLEILRLHDDKALQLIERASGGFESTGNAKGLAECAYLRGKILFFAEKLPAANMPEEKGFSSDQKIVGRLFSRLDPLAGKSQESALFKMLGRIESKKVRFDALRLLLKKYRKSEWLESFRAIAWELSSRVKNYYYYEYWYLYFDLTGEGIPFTQRDEFLAMHDFFTVNKRTLSATINRLRQHIDESEKDRNLFNDARLVENFRQWRLPEDFFNGLLYEIGRPTPIDWLIMAVHEDRQPLFRFANSDRFRELGDEMLQNTLEMPENKNLDLQDIRREFRSQERFFFPFASTKMIRWPITERILACLVIGFHDQALYFQDFFDRHRETFKKFSVLFQNFLQNEYRIHEKLSHIIGKSEKIKELKGLIAKVGKVDFSLLITGESGSGKELVAHAVHLLSPRADQPFIPVNAAAIPETLLEAELFGYKKGAFSGASENRVGLLEAADRGTLFLDEIADLPMPLQAKLLRALQEKEIRRLGENKTIKIDVRLISASNKDLGELIKKNEFREDLFYRLQDLVIHIPPLRERREDIPLLVGHFLQKFGYRLQDQSKWRTIADRFGNESFPGNVRELESKIKQMITFNPELDAPVVAAGPRFSLKSARQAFEKNLLLNTLNEQCWRKNNSAEKLGISRMALFNLLKKHKIKK